MGYELSNLMKQYGVGSASVGAYRGPTVGAAPTAPTEVVKPVAPTKPVAPKKADFATTADYDLAQSQYTAANAKYTTDLANYNAAVKSYGTDTAKYNEDLKTFNQDKAAFDEAVRKYNLGQKEYGTYRENYMNRLGGTDMYATPEYATGLANEPKVKDWGAPVAAPIYDRVPVSLAGQTTQQMADFYKQRRDLGYTDADLRNATTKSLGAPKESDWTTIMNLAYPEYAQNVTSAYGNIGRTGFGSDFSKIDNPGYNYWMNQLSSGAVKPEDFNTTFNSAVNKQITENPNDPYSEYVNNYLNSLVNTGAAGTTNTAGNTGTAGTTNIGMVNTPYTGMGGVNTSYRGMSNLGTAYYAHGGPVKTHYQTAGAVTLPSGYSDPENEAEWMNRWNSQQQPVEINPVNMVEPPMPVTSVAAPVAEVVAPKSTLTDLAAIQAQTAPTPVTQDVVPPILVSKPAAVPFGDERMANIQTLLAAYGPKDSAYAADLKTARASAKAESDAFANMLKNSMKSPEDEQSSKAEMYFRLAAAFGAPTKTGQFSENLGMVGKELGEYAKDKRASSQNKLALAIKAQEMKMTAAKDDLRTLQALAGEEMKDKREIAKELLKDYIKSGEPQSAAGKQAVDEGLKPGSPEYQKRVAAIGNMNVEGKMAQINATLANLSIAQANLALRQNQAAKLSPTEITMKREVEDTVNTTDQSLKDLKQAYALNPNSLAGGWMDKSQQWLSEAAGSKDPVVVNTRILNNLLGAQGLAKLKSTFGGNPTEGERAILMELEGIGSKTKEERAAIIRRTYKVLQEKRARDQRRLDDINSGAYRMTSPIEGGSE